MAKNKTLQAIVEIAGTISPTLGKSIEQATGKLNGLKLGAIGVGVATGATFAAMGKAVLAAGKYLLDLGTQFDQVTDAIRIGTGATGNALDGLVDDFEAVYSAVPTTMEDASQAIADYNTRLDLSGEALQNLSVQAIQVADMLGEDLGTVIESSSEAFKAWNIDAENMGDAMDYVFKASQSTGVGFSDLLSSVQTLAPQLQELGYSFEESIALIGQLEKSGVNTSEVLSAMKKSVGALAKEGISASEGLAQYTEAIKNAGDMTEATSIASEIFGSKAASTMAAAIRDGTIDVAELTAALEENQETINGCAEDTYDFSEKLQLFKQKAEVALEPLASTIFDALNDLMPVVGELMEGLIPIIEETVEQIKPIVEQLVPTLLPMLQQLLPPLLEIGSTLLTELLPPITEIVLSVVPMLVDLLNMLTPILSSLISTILPIVVNFMQQLLPVLMKIVQAVLPVVAKLLNAILPLLESLLSAILPVIIELIDALLPLAMTIIDAILPVVIQLLDTIVPILVQIIDAILPVVIELINQVTPIIQQLMDAVLPVLIEVLNMLTPILDLVISLLQPILDLFMQLIEPILSLATSALTPLIEIFTNLISSVLEPIQPILTTLASLFTDVLGTAISAITPIIETLQSIFSGLIDFISGVFSGNWEQAWNGIVEVFKGIFNLIPTAVETVINAAIDLINGIIEGINSVSSVVGIEIGLIDHVTLPKLGAGGFTDGISIAGEAGTEAVISFDPAYRDANIGYWMEAGEKLGVTDDGTASTAGKLLSLDDFSLGDLTDSGTVVYYDFSNFTWSPTVEGSDEEEDDVLAKLKTHEAEFFDWLEEWVQLREEGQFCDG